MTNYEQQLAKDETMRYDVYVAGYFVLRCHYFGAVQQLISTVRLHGGTHFLIEIAPFPAS